MLLVNIALIQKEIAPQPKKVSGRKKRAAD